VKTKFKKGDVLLVYKVSIPERVGKNFYLLLVADCCIIVSIPERVGKNHSVNTKYFGTHTW
ncbi:MAG: hypothetical protein RMJ37_08195, partial [Spirochaetia bacterium]|nr:hypothetical protein [Spirochaetota bacterium]MDW8113295.1 hypothetical protein [Spirochaetia bacterium]